MVAMSGSVDSSVAAALLVKQGYEVIGMMMRLWSEPGKEESNRCCTPDAMAVARRVAAKLDIPFYAVDAQNEFYNSVVSYFVDGYAQGITPNPCLVCNRHIRWDYLLNRALAIGASYLATGHYARLKNTEEGRIQLLRGIDRGKEQSYVLYVLNQKQLSNTMFPLGGYTKSAVRQIAAELNLPAADRNDSQDLCFLAGGDYRNFLLRNAPQLETPGPILSRKDETLGQHRGHAFYTIGQRKGLQVSSSRPLYVLDKDVSRNALIVGQKNELGKQELIAKEINWISGHPPVSPVLSQVKIRYKAKKANALVTPLDSNRAHVRFDDPLIDITPGQAAVFYKGEVCLGGGVIQV